MTPVELAPLAAAALVVAAIGPGPRARRHAAPPDPPGRAGGVRWPTSTTPAPGWLVAGLADAAIDVPAASVHRAWWVAIAVATGLGAVGHGPAGAVVAGASVALALPVGLRATRHRARHLADRALPATLEAVASSLRGGRSLLQALADVARGTDPAAGELARVVAEAEAGLGLPNALARWSQRGPGPDRRLAVAALMVGAESGAPPARALDGVAATLRERRAVEREAVALSTQARASVGVLVATPPLFALAASAVDPRVGRFLLGEPLGLACLVVGLGLDLLGAGWMRAMVRGAR